MMPDMNVALRPNVKCITIEVLSCLTHAISMPGMLEPLSVVRGSIYIRSNSEKNGLENDFRAPLHATYSVSY